MATGSPLLSGSFEAVVDDWLYHQWDRDPAELLHEFERVMSSNSATLERVYSIEGAELKAPHVIDETITLRPSPPPSGEREVFAPTGPSFEVVITEPVSPIWEPSDGRTWLDKLAHAGASGFLNPHAKATDVLYAAALCWPSYLNMPKFSAGFLEAGMPSYPRTWMGLMDGGTPPLRPLKPYIDPQAVSGVFGQLQSFTKAAPLRVAADRLLRSRRTADTVSRALELGIALEVMLMHGDVKGAEITNKLAFRAAWLLGDDLPTRKEIRKRASSAYGLRSIAAHHGALSAESSKELHEAKVDELVRGVALSLLKRGRFPDWSDLLLGGKG